MTRSGRTTRTKTKRKSGRKLRLPSFRVRRGSPWPKNDEYATHYARALILEDISSFKGAWVTTHDLRRHKPDRYSVKLKKTLEDMDNRGLLVGRRARVLGTFTIAYRVQAEVRAEVRARLADEEDPEEVRIDLKISEHTFRRLRA